MFCIIFFQPSRRYGQNTKSTCVMFSFVVIFHVSFCVLPCGHCTVGHQSRMEVPWRGVDFYLQGWWWLRDCNQHHFWRSNEGMILWLGWTYTLWLRTMYGSFLKTGIFQPAMLVYKRFNLEWFLLKQNLGLIQDDPSMVRYIFTPHGQRP